jgi:hypothetical protein
MPLIDNITEMNFSGNKFFIMLIPQLSHFPENESSPPQPFGKFEPSLGEG